ncbi:MAG: phosphoribosylanthranilate isomerase [Aphanocapsa sp. GSE-SYN-MK-11-07L]|jgi:phosphoribosylanthranilate isomerase|nr:phosphoribosylanthranilate isomerase [Aphanocapsa sp. GSE-SYN-MK-11-07L]
MPFQNSHPLRVKICGITQRSQGLAIAQLGASALGFICVPSSPRYVSPEQIQLITQALPNTVATIGVFADADLETIRRTVAIARLSGVQLHGSESPEFCWQLRQLLPAIEIIKAIRIKTAAMLAVADDYAQEVDTLLLDAYADNQLGGTGKTIDWEILQNFQPRCPWLLAGGLTPDNVAVALRQLQPNGIDLSSGVERSPGHKDLNRVQALFEQLNTVWSGSLTPSGVKLG